MPSNLLFFGSPPGQGTSFASRAAACTCRRWDLVFSGTILGVARTWQVTIRQLTWEHAEPHIISTSLRNIIVYGLDWADSQTSRRGANVSKPSALRRVVYNAMMRGITVWMRARIYLLLHEF